MRRIPSGLRKITKDELFTQLTHQKDEPYTLDTEGLDARIGWLWSKPEDEKNTKPVIRW